MPFWEIKIGIISEFDKLKLKLVWSKNKLEKLRKIGRLEEEKKDFGECNISGVKTDEFG